MLYKVGYEWQYDEEIFRVIAPLILKDKLEIQQGWKGDKKATRTIFNGKLLLQEFYSALEIQYVEDMFRLFLQYTSDAPQF